MIDSYRSSGFFAGVEKYSEQKMREDCCAEKNSSFRHEVDKASASFPAHFVIAPPVSVPMPATPVPVPAEPTGIMAELGKFIGQAIDALSYVASSIKKFVMGLSLFKDWFVKS